MTTKAKILMHYEREVKARYPWTQDADKLKRFMEVARDMLDGAGPGVDRKGHAWRAALSACSLPADMSLAALQALPPGDLE